MVTVDLCLISAPARSEKAAKPPTERKVAARVRPSANARATSRLPYQKRPQLMCSGRREVCMCSSPKCPWPLIYPGSLSVPVSRVSLPRLSLPLRALPPPLSFTLALPLPVGPAWAQPSVSIHSHPYP